MAELRQRFPEGLVAIALELGRGPVIAALMHYDFLRLYPINPKSLARYRETFSSSGAKDDPTDAALLLDLLVNGGKTWDDMCRRRSWIFYARAEGINWPSAKNRRLSKVFRGKRSKCHGGILFEPNCVSRIWMLAA